MRITRGKCALKPGADFGAGEHSNAGPGQCAAAAGVEFVAVGVWQELLWEICE